LGGGWFDTRLQRPLRAEADRCGVRVAPAPAYGSACWRTGGVLRSGFPVPPEAGADLERVIVAINAAGQAWTAEQSDDVSVAEWLARLDPLPATREFVYGWCGLMAGARMDVTPVSALLGARTSRPSTRRGSPARSPPATPKRARRSSCS
jgi:hypothetical protein